ncbi:MAG: hypothetical protein IJH43_06945 [Mogibacterium sp.]|nr:hypothetical protein [Mogibacterium sp.]
MDPTEKEMEEMLLKAIEAAGLKDNSSRPVIQVPAKDQPKGLDDLALELEGILFPADKAEEPQNLSSFIDEPEDSIDEPEFDTQLFEDELEEYLPESERDTFTQPEFDDLGLEEPDFEPEQVVIEVSAEEAPLAIDETDPAELADMDNSLQIDDLDDFLEDQPEMDDFSLLDTAEESPLETPKQELELDHMEPEELILNAIKSDKVYTKFPEELLEPPVSEEPEIADEKPDELDLDDFLAFAEDGEPTAPQDDLANELSALLNEEPADAQPETFEEEFDVLPIAEEPAEPEIELNIPEEPELDAIPEDFEVPEIEVPEEAVPEEELDDFYVKLPAEPELGETQAESDLADELSALLNEEPVDVEIEPIEEVVDTQPVGEELAEPEIELEVPGEPEFEAIPDDFEVPETEVIEEAVPEEEVADFNVELPAEPELEETQAEPDLADELSALLNEEPADVEVKPIEEVVDTQPVGEELAEPEIELDIPEEPELEPHERDPEMLPPELEEIRSAEAGKSNEREATAGATGPASLNCAVGSARTVGAVLAAAAGATAASELADSHPEEAETGEEPTEAEEVTEASEALPEEVEIAETEAAPDTETAEEPEKPADTEAAEADKTVVAAAVPPTKKRRKYLSKSKLIAIIIVELILVAAACYAIFNISWGHINERRSDAVTSTIQNYDAKKPITAKIKKAMKNSKEAIVEVVDETVWATDSVNYRVGPGTKYESAGVLNAYTSVKRTGKTMNGWSQVVINDETYYINSEYLSTEVPLITEGGQKGEYQRYALSQLPNYGWAESEIIPLINLWNRESGWNPSSHNRSSGAHGIPQALPASKMASEGSDYYTNGNTQIRWGLGYISSRYGSPSNAWAHFSSHGWY